MRRSLSARFRSLFVSFALAVIAVGGAAASVLADSGGGPFPR
jgi:hypothetical protein